jgi:hypothetical protein
MIMGHENKDKYVQPENNIYIIYSRINMLCDGIKPPKPVNTPGCRT